LSLGGGSKKKGAKKAGRNRESDAQKQKKQAKGEEKNAMHALE